MSERSRRFRRFRRRTADDFNNRPAIIRRDGNNLSRDGDNLASNSLVDDRLTDLTPRDESSFNHQRNPRRKSIKRDREDDISTGNKVHLKSRESFVINHFSDDRLVVRMDRFSRQQLLREILL